MATEKEEPKQVSWKVSKFAKAVDLSKSYVYVLMNEEIIKSVKVKGARLITTSPEEFIANLKKD